MNANEITFGVEFETNMPIGSVTVGGYRSGEQVDWLPRGWQAKTDCSIQPKPGHMGVEFVSPVLQGEDGIQKVVQVLAAITAHGGSVNASCGCHVHVGWSFDTKSLERLINLVANFETAIFATTGTIQRAMGRWCQSIQRHGSTRDVAGQAGSCRYHILNLTNLLNPTRPNTVEFRAFGGTLNPVKAVGYIRLCVGLVERACEASRRTEFVAKKPKASSPITRNGVGQTARRRLFYQLGWTKGRAKKVYGAIAGEIDDKAIKAELVRLAKKFDERFEQLPEVLKALYRGRE